MRLILFEDFEMNVLMGIMDNLDSARQKSEKSMELSKNQKAVSTNGNFHSLSMR